MTEDQPESTENKPEASQNPENVNKPFAPQSHFGIGIQPTLPNSMPVLILGILSIVTCICYGIVGLIMGVIALILAKKDKALLLANPNAYSQSSVTNLNAGRICAIIGVILGALFLLYIIGIILFFGFAALQNPALMQEMMRGR